MKTYQKPQLQYCPKCDANTYHIDNLCQECYSNNFREIKQIVLLFLIVGLLMVLSLSSCSIKRSIVNEPFICQNTVKSGSLCEYKFVPLNYAYAVYLIEDTGAYAKFDTVSFERVKMGIKFK